MDREYSRKRARSPRRDRYSPDSGSGGYRRHHSDNRERGRDERVRERQEFSRPYEHGDSKMAGKPTAEKVVDHNVIPAPPGFPLGYTWSKGDWLCPSPGCEGYVTVSRYQNCIHCGRSMPYFVVLTELAKQPGFRTEMCKTDACSLRHCAHAHSRCELRDLERSRVYIKVSENSSVPPGVPEVSREDLAGFIHRWKIGEPGVSVLGRLPSQLGDLVLRTYYLDPVLPDSESTNRLLKCLADLIRPRVFQVRSSVQLHELLPAILRRCSAANSSAAACSGLASSSEDGGYLAITLEKEVAVIACRDFSSEDLGLLAFAVAFHGMSVVHSVSDLNNIKQNFFPKLYVNLLDRVRVVDNPSEIIYVAAALEERLADRASQARLDALNPSPLLPTPESAGNDDDD